MEHPSLLIVALLCAVAQVPVRADATSAARQGIQVGYNKMLAAVQNQNGLAFLACLTPDFRAIDRSGKAMTRQDLVKMLKQMKSAKGHTSAQITIRIQQVTLHGKEATVLEEQFMGSSHSRNCYRDLWSQRARAGASSNLGHCPKK